MSKTDLAASRPIAAYAGLLALLACLCMISAFVPAAASPGALGGILLTAAVFGVLIEFIAKASSTLLLRLAWSGLAAVTGACLMLSPRLGAPATEAVLVAFLLVQAVMLIGLAIHARRLKEIGSRPLAMDGLVTLALAGFVAMAFPFQQSWVLGAVIAVGILDYAAALSFREIDARAHEAPAR